MNSPGLHDPYWYENTLGEWFMVDMLDPSSGITSVTVQSPDFEGIDDIVVRYENRRTACYQVKHTRSGDTISFADLVRAKDSGVSLLRRLARGWRKQIEVGDDCETYLFTNRESSERTAIIEWEGKDVRLPSLSAFWSAVKGAQTMAGIDESAVLNAWGDAWRCFVGQLSDLDDEQRLRFLETLNIQWSQPALEALVDRVIVRLQEVFGISAEKAHDVMAHLDSGLRTWSTSLRGDQFEVTPEVVLRQLQLRETEARGDHDLPPPAPPFPSRQPFIELVGADLRSAKHPITFLTGPAGSGKTSVVSSLAARAEPLIDLRFHAFRPIAPDSDIVPQDVGRTATAQALWGDLLAQLRERFFAHRLREAKVPVRNAFIADQPELLQAQVLRLAGVLASERGRPTVIAIDGIDHAARARRRAPEQFLHGPLLLDYLVPPDAVPEGVVFLIAGQPNESYPLWLRSHHPAVGNVAMPAIASDDIAAELRGKPGSLPIEQIDAAARIIDSLTNGNTLAAVYGVHEARTISNVEELEAHLRSRRLSSDLEEYYDAIWSAALAPFIGDEPGIDAALATALSTSSVRLTGETLSRYFPHLKRSPSAWTSICRSLAPLLEEERGGFALRHNDTRVALTARLVADPEGFREAASAIADYLIGAPATDQKYADVFRLLTYAERQRDMPRVFTTRFVVEASALDRPISELMSQARQAARGVSSTLGWDALHEFGLGLASLLQLRRIEGQGRRPRRAGPVPAFLSSEALGGPREKWTKRTYAGIFRDAELLVAAGEIDRAASVLSRLMGDTSPDDLGASFESAADAERTLNERKEVHAGGILRAWGRVAQKTGLPGSVRESCSDKTSASDAGGSFFGGWLFGGLDNADRPWTQTLREAVTFHDFDIEDCCIELAAAGRWEDVGVTLRHLTAQYESLPMTLRIHGAAWAIRIGTADLADPWVKAVAEHGSSLVAAYERPGTGEGIWRGTLDGAKARSYPDVLDLCVATAYVLGAARPGRPESAIAEETFRVWAKTRDFGEASAIGELLYLAAWTGRLMQAFHAHGTEAVVGVQPRELKEKFESLLFMPQRAVVGSFHGGRALLGDLLRIVHESGSKPHVHAISESLVRYADERLWGRSLEMVWTALYERGETKRLREWLLHWIGPEGKAWTIEYAERIDAVETFGGLGRMAGFDEDVAAAEDRLRWTFISYDSHKEYALHTPLEWFERARQAAPEIWETYGARFLSVSHEASREGDNRFSLEIEASIGAAAAAVSPSELWRFLEASAEGGTAFGQPAAIEGMIGALVTAHVSEDDLVAMWCAGLGSLVWQVERDQHLLRDLRDAIVAAAVRLGFPDLPTRLRSIAPFEFDIPRRERSGYGFPDRWFSPTTATLDPERDALTIEVEQLPIEAAIAALEPALHRARQTRYGNTGGVWRAAASCVKRLVADKPPKFRAHLRDLMELAASRDDPYSWSYDGYDDLLRELIPLMSEAERWQLCERMLSALDRELDRESALNAIGENIRTLRLAAADDTERQLRGLDTELRTQELWIRGPNGENRKEWPLYTWPVEPGIATWSDLTVKGLLPLLDSGEAHPTQAAIRGVYALLRWIPAANEAVAAQFPALPERAQRFALLALERLAADTANAFGAWHETLEGVAHSSSAPLKLQAAIVLRTGDRVRGDKPRRVDFGEMPPHEHSAIIQPVESLLRVPDRRQGSVSFADEWSAAATMAQRIALAFDLDEDEIEAEIAKRVRDIPVQNRSRKIKTRFDGDTRLIENSWSPAITEWALTEWRSGCFGPCDPELLCQAVLDRDDPYILTMPAEAAHVPWPVDDELTRLVEKGEAALREALLPVLSAGLTDDEILLAAALRTYDWRSDVRLYLERYLPSARVNSRHWPWTFNGRAFVLFREDRYEPPECNDWMTLRPAGSGFFSHSSIDLLPAIRWQSFGWQPDQQNPFLWVASGGGIVARYELLRGPIRPNLQDRLYRQPTLHRWRASREAVAHAESSAGARFSDIVTSQVDTWR
ncbi:MAG: ATP-binding protein [Acidobacteriota bacterium]|nr:ATP-binding protein [Acidobacteriota bacterium]